METDKLTGEIIGAAMKVHSALGPGLLESAYEACLKYELMKRGLAVESQVPLTGLLINFHELHLRDGIMRRKC